QGFQRVANILQVEGFARRLATGIFERQGSKVVPNLFGGGASTAACMLSIYEPLQQTVRCQAISTVQTARTDLASGPQPFHRGTPLQIDRQAPDHVMRAG